MMTTLAVDGSLSRLSVLVSSYNKLEFLSQSRVFLEDIVNLGGQVIIIEDSSTDGSISYIQAWQTVQNKSIQLVLQRNAGSAVSRNSAVFLANRDYLLFVDIDDVVDVRVLTEIFPQVLRSSADLALTGYIQVPANRIGPYPLTDYVNSTIEISQHRTELLEGVGWWRYLYRRSTVVSNQMRFVPSFQEMGGKIFVLDDLLWLLHLFSLNLRIYRAGNSDILYKYFLPDKVSSARRQWYMEQVVLIPDALRIFLDDLDSHKCSHDEIWLYSKCYELLWQHANFLDLNLFLRNVFKFLAVSILIKRRLGNSGLFDSLRSTIYTGMRLTFLRVRSATYSKPTHGA